ncbi:Uncharacterized conserved protein [Burkholderia pseudomallei]|nr:Uncharacterized conserved protein [Burkholderia pseudomallei]
MAFSSAELQKLGDLLTGYHFHIPDYQRGYSWGEAQLEALWADLQIAVRSEAKQHFTGIVLLRKLELNGTALPSVELVDGQQRVISAMALARALAHQGANADTAEETSRLLEFKVNFIDNAELQTYFDFWAMNDEREAARLGPNCSSYAANIENAARFFRERAGDLDAATARAYLEALLDRFRLFVLDAHPEFDIHVAFETLNNRGKKLTTLELLKNRLIYLTNILPDQVSDGEKVSGESALSDETSPLTGKNVRVQIHRAWKGIYRSLGRSPATQNHDDEFLRAHAIGYFGEERDADWVENVLFNETFTANNANLTLAEIPTYIRSLEEAAVWWSHMHEPKLMPRMHQRQHARFARVTYAYFKPLILAAYMRAGAEAPHALAQPGEHEALLRPVAALLQQIERFIVIVLTLSGRAAHLGRADMNNLAHRLLCPESAPETSVWVKCGGPEMTASEAVFLARDYVKAYIDNGRMDGSRLDERFEWEGEFSAAAVEQQIAERMRLGGTGFYKWAFTRLLLLEYEEAQRDEGSKPIKLKWPWDEFSFDKTVEHIFPQTPDDDGYWNDVIAIDGRSKALRNAVVHSLGNLMLLSVKRNPAVSNLPFRTKDGSRCKVTSYEQGSYSETQVAHIFREWNIAAIAARGVALLKFAEKRWSFSLTDKPDDYSSYLPFLFGERADEVREGYAGKKVDGRSINTLVNDLLADRYVA